MTDSFALIVISAVINGLFAVLAVYLGVLKGTGKTVDIALDRIEKRAKESPTAQRLMKLAEMSDKLFGDDQAVEQMTGFFKSARELAEEGKRLASSPEAKNFFVNLTELMKQLGGEGEKKPLINVPERKT